MVGIGVHANIFIKNKFMRNGLLHGNKISVVTTKWVVTLE